jgi:hypothetical protein
MRPKSLEVKTFPRQTTAFYGLFYDFARHDFATSSAAKGPLTQAKS